MSPPVSLGRQHRYTRNPRRPVQHAVTSPHISLLPSPHDTVVSPPHHLVPHRLSVHHPSSPRLLKPPRITASHYITSHHPHRTLTAPLHQATQISPNFNQTATSVVSQSLNPTSQPRGSSLMRTYSRSMDATRMTWGCRTTPIIWIAVHIKTFNQLYLQQVTVWVALCMPSCSTFAMTTFVEKGPGRY